MAQATTEDYAPASLTELDAAYDAAVARVPADGMGFTEDSRRVLFEQIDKAAALRRDAVYATAEDVATQAQALDDARNALVEEPLGEEFRITVRYQRPVKDAPSDLIHEYFLDAEGNLIEKTLTVRQGQEVRLPIDDPLIQHFDGYTPASFHLDSDDGTLGLVRVLTDSHGNRTVVFRAATSNAQAGGSLDIRYVEDDAAAPDPDGQPTPGPTDPATAAPDDQDGDRAEEPTAPGDPAATASATASTGGVGAGNLARTGAPPSAAPVLAVVLLAGGALVLTRGRRRA